LTRFRKNIQASYLMKIRTMGVELFHLDGRADMTKLQVAFRNFMNSPGKYYSRKLYLNLYSDSASFLLRGNIFYLTLNKYIDVI
jgi:hypothetical protein